MLQHSSSKYFQAAFHDDVIDVADRTTRQMDLIPGLVGPHHFSIMTQGYGLNYHLATSVIPVLGTKNRNFTFLSPSQLIATSPSSLLWWYMIWDADFEEPHFVFVWKGQGDWRSALLLLLSSYVSVLRHIPFRELHHSCHVGLKNDISNFTWLQSQQKSPCEQCSEMARPQVRSFHLFYHTNFCRFLHEIYSTAKLDRMRS